MCPQRPEKIKNALKEDFVVQEGFNRRLLETRDVKPISGASLSGTDSVFKYFYPKK